MQQQTEGQEFTHCAEVESLLIGAIIQDPLASVEIRETICGNHFRDVDLGATYDLLIAAADSGGPLIDTAMLRAEMIKAGLWSKIGAHSIAKWVSASFPCHIKWYASEVKRFWLKRELENLGLSIASESVKTQDAGDLVNYASGKLDAIRHNLVDNTQDLASALTETAKEIQESCNRGAPLGLPCGFASIDEQTGGFHPGTFTILAARPSVGKSALALDMAMRIVERGRAVMLISLEMTGKDLSYRCFSREMQVSVKTLQNGLLDVAGQIEMFKAKERLRTLPLHLMAKGSANVGQVKAKAKLLQASQDLKLIIVDYLGLMNASTNNSKLTTYERTSAVSRELKQMAMDLQLPILCLAQLNREVEKASRRPRLSDLRDSGAIEQDADNVWFLHRENLLSETAELIIAKQRQGEVGTIELSFNGAVMRFADSSEAQTWDEVA